MCTDDDDVVEEGTQRSRRERRLGQPYIYIYIYVSWYLIWTFTAGREQCHGGGFVVEA